MGTKGKTKLQVKAFAPLKKKKKKSGEHIKIKTRDELLGQ